MRSKDKKWKEPKGWRTKFYYIRRKDEQKFPVVSVCLKHDMAMGRVSRGVAICAMDFENEQTRNKKIGRSIAETRARYAMRNQCKHLQINDINRFDPVAQNFIYISGIDWMCEFNPDLTEKEEDILGLYDFGKEFAPIMEMREEGILTRLWDWVEEKLS